ncbi:hypothetical protein BKM25_23170 [Pseudomonas avellanae]|uniref:Uncharacterized protein n=2 Tax=Pseudomonas avellanae TaxID=46257 RepID=A0AAD0GUK1_9PSED|nr:hypothetical protein BKM03_31175 [Pseudomonas avellanae]PHN34519.1 hypothetical protein AO261_26590 [Pseudomonas avellanae]POC82054.1 hypothetical protein BKM26_27585 [Pseudomonas avellanae]POP74918.1 hypothetical protein CXB34_28305 [Pseudomonas amygdali pv. morsprunorum]POR73174.1 hypothetical protein BKM25_23170 [Pseudomonas avellanae]
MLTPQPFVTDGCIVLQFNFHLFLSDSGEQTLHPPTATAQRFEGWACVYQLLFLCVDLVKQRLN